MPLKITNFFSNEGRFRGNIRPFAGFMPMFSGKYRQLFLQNTHPFPIKIGMNRGKRRVFWSKIRLSFLRIAYSDEKNELAGKSDSVLCVRNMPSGKTICKWENNSGICLTIMPYFYFDSLMQRPKNRLFSPNFSDLQIKYLWFVQ